MMKLKNALAKSNYPIKTCKLCFKNYTIKSFNSLFNDSSFICDKCLKEFKPKFYRYTINGVEGISIYDYDDNMKSLIYQFKGCYDIELKDIFITPYKHFLKLSFLGYHLVAAPSYQEDEKERGFSHVKEIFSPLNKKVLDVLYKTDNFKQSDQSFLERKNIKDHIKIKNKHLIKNKSILLVDDILTTGNTLASCVELLKNEGAKKIKILTLAKVIPKNDEFEHRYIQKTCLIDSFLKKSNQIKNKYLSKRVIKKDD